MTKREMAERARLSRLWATGKATFAQVRRCMELDRKAGRDMLQLGWKEESNAKN